MIIPEKDKYYRVIVKGYEVILKGQGPMGSKNHCITCTCRDDKPSFIFVEGYEGAVGRVRVDDIEEVVKTKDGWQSLA